MLAEYADTKSPQVNLTASIPWSRASATSAPGMSAFCYGFGAEAVQAHPEVPIGLQNNAWGGVAIQVYMSPAAMQECAHVAAPQPSTAERLASDDRSFYALAAAAQAGEQSAQPGTPSCLYNSMTYPLLSSPITGILWYQGKLSDALTLRASTCTQVFLRLLTGGVVAPALTCVVMIVWHNCIGR